MTAAAKSQYDQRKARETERQREQSAAGRCIGRLRGPLNPKRFEACRSDLEKFLREYLPLYFPLPFCADQRKVIGKNQECVQSGGLHAYAMPRGAGKTTIAAGTSLWASLYGHIEFLNVISSDEKASKLVIQKVRFPLQWSDLLLEDFYEICWPIRCIGNAVQKVPGQTYERDDGEIVHTFMTWNADAIAYPAIAGHPGASSFIMVAGLTGGLRGVSFVRPVDGRIVRPSLVILDDPQTRESAGSLTQTADREAIIMGDVLSMAGPAQSIAALMPCTIINRGDLADNFLDHKKHPEWNGTTTKMLNSLPVDLESWDKYREIQVAFDPDIPGDARQARDRATEFYRENREAMDAGAEASWPERFEKHQISAIQCAMDLYYRDRAAFFAEYQNEPEGDEDESELLTPEQINAKRNGIPRGIVPVTATTITAFIDCQKDLLYYTVIAWEAGFTGYVIDYGTWPDQPRSYFDLSEASPTIAQVTHISDDDGMLFAALNRLTDGPRNAKGDAGILAREWIRQDGSAAKINLCMIDAGYKADVVYQFCRQSPHAAIIRPSHGKGIGVNGKPMFMWRPQKNQLRGTEWFEGRSEGRATRYMMYETNFHKSFVHARLAVPMGSVSCLSMFGDKAANHRMLADHVTSEKPDKMVSETTGRRATIWTLKPNRDNHLFDCIVGATAAASRLGVKLPVHEDAKKDRVKFSERFGVNAKGRR